MNAKERIDLKEDRARYKKVGKKYVQCNDYDAYEGLEDGWWLVKVQPYCKTMRACVYPDNAEILTATKDAEDRIVEIIRKAGEARPKEGVPLSEQAAADWKYFVQKHGAEFNMLYYPSLQENAEKILAAILDYKSSDPKRFNS